jgi:hypothetical protein
LLVERVDLQENALEVSLIGELQQSDDRMVRAA